MLSQLLSLDGIESVVLERRSRAHVESRMQLAEPDDMTGFEAGLTVIAENDVGLPVT